MSTSIVIDLKLTGAGSLSRGLKQSQQQIASYNKGASQVGQTYAKAAKQVGVFSDAVKKAQALQAAMKTGDQLKIADASYANFLADQRATSARNKMLGINKTKPPAAQPAGSRRLGRAGLISAVGLGELIPAVGIATAAITAMAEAARAASEQDKSRIEALGGMYGANPRTADAARIAAGATGISPGDWTAINDAVRNGQAPYTYQKLANEEAKSGRSYAPSAGIYGTLDPTQTRQAVIDYMTDPGVSQRDKYRMAYQLKQPNLSSYMNMSRDEAYRMEGLGQNFDPKRAQRDRNTDSRVEDMGQKILAEGWRSTPIYHFLNWLGGGGVHSGVSGLGGGGQDVSKDLTNAIKENTAAVRSNSGNLKPMGFYGSGGERTNGLPIAAWSHKEVQAEMDGMTAQLGGFKL